MKILQLEERKIEADLVYYQGGQPSCLKKAKLQCTLVEVVAEMYPFSTMNYLGQIKGFDS